MVNSRVLIGQVICEAPVIRPPPKRVPRFESRHGRILMSSALQALMSLLISKAIAFRHLNTALLRGTFQSGAIKL